MSTGSTALAQGADVLIHMCHFVSGAVTDPRGPEVADGRPHTVRPIRFARVHGDVQPRLAGDAKVFGKKRRRIALLVSGKVQRHQSFATA